MKKQMFFIPNGNRGHRVNLTTEQQVRLKANKVFFYPCGDPHQNTLKDYVGVAIFALIGIAVTIVAVHPLHG